MPENEIPVVSIIMAAFNAEDFIGSTIESVRGQTFQDWELVIVNDGSTDKTLAIAEEAKRQDGRIQVIDRLNQGAHIARNIAFQASRGKYIAILDADDRLLPEKLQIQVELLETKREFDVVYGDTWHCDEKMNRLILESEKYRGQQHSGNVFAKIVLGNLFAVHSALTRRECFEETGLHRDERDLIGDWDLWVRVAVNHNFLYHQDPVCEYRLHSQMSARKDASEKQFAQRMGVVRHIEKMPEFKRLGRVKLSTFIFANGRFAQKFHLHKEARNLFIEALKINPINYRAMIMLAYSILK